MVEQRSRGRLDTKPDSLFSTCANRCYNDHDDSINSVSSYLFAGGVRLSLNGELIANHSYVDVDNIGEDDNALLCHTNNSECCSSYYPGQIRAGEWYYPDGTYVGIEAFYENEFYRNRGSQVVRLNHRQGDFTQRGLFRCELPDSTWIQRTVYVNIGECSNEKKPPRYILI